MNSLKVFADPTRFNEADRTTNMKNNQVTGASFDSLDQYTRDRISFEVVQAFMVFVGSGDSIPLARRKVYMTTGYREGIVRRVLYSNAAINSMIKERVSKHRNAKKLR